MSELKRLTDRIWYYTFEQERDRPNLGYIRGDRWSLAVDAGHSEDHTLAFYRALEASGLPLPSLTVLTHWHWDHTFGMHAANGLCLANERTERHLVSVRERIEREGREQFMSMDGSIQKEYEDGRPIIVKGADMLFSGEMLLDAGNCRIRVFQAQSPHTDDATLIYAEDEKVLFLGDSTCGAFPSWEKDPELCDKLAGIIRASEAEICLEGHWVPTTKEDVIDDLMSDDQNLN